MKKLNFLIIALLGSALMFNLTSCSSDDDTNFTMTNQDFVTRASSSNMFEIEAGTLAVNKGANDAVKAFGQHMITDHGKTATEMTALVHDKNWTLPQAMLQEHQDKYNALSALSGAAFDKQFATMMVTSHQQTIMLFEQASSDTGVPDADLRAFAAGKLPTLRAHLEEAQALQTDVNND
jgi:putative membrane protein